MRVPVTTMPRLARLALAGVLGLGLVACTAEEGAQRERPGGEAAAQGQILQPGRPGEANQTMDPDASVAAAPTNEADEMFVRMMVPHHAQALEMCALARSRARDDQVLAMARRIEGAQGPELMALTSWLQSRGIDVPRTLADLASHEGHTDHEAHEEAMSMHGMLTKQQMRALERARGSRFDRLFVAGMIQHHEGAVAMADTAGAEGSDLLALEMAAEISAGQSAEIERLRDIRGQL